MIFAPLIFALTLVLWEVWSLATFSVHSLLQAPIKLQIAMHTVIEWTKTVTKLILVSQNKSKWFGSSNCQTTVLRDKTIEAKPCPLIFPHTKTPTEYSGPQPDLHRRCRCWQWPGRGLQSGHGRQSVVFDERKDFGMTGRAFFDNKMAEILGTLPNVSCSKAKKSEDRRSERMWPWVKIRFGMVWVPFSGWWTTFLCFTAVNPGDFIVAFDPLPCEICKIAPLSYPDVPKHGLGKVGQVQVVLEASKRLKHLPSIPAAL